MNETCMKHALNMPDIGGCPYCEIDRLKAELEEERNAAFPTVDKTAKPSGKGCLVVDCGSYSLELSKEASVLIQDLEHQLAEARAENERLNDKITRLMRVEQMDKHIVDQARQEAARECTKIVHNLGCTYGLGTAERGLLVYAADLLLQKLGLEEVRDVQLS